MAGAGFFTKLRLLFWKYIQYRRYHWALTIIEICIPVLLVYIVATLTEQYDETQGKVEEEGSGKTTIEDMARFLGNLSTIYFGPKESESESELPISTYMNKFQQLIALKDEKNYVKGVQYRSVKNEHDLAQVVLQNENRTIGIHFLECSNKSFRYKLRYRYLWKTYQLYDEDESTQMKPTQTFDKVENVDLKKNEPYFSEGFGPVQYFLDQAYIAIRIDSSPSPQDKNYPYSGIQENIMPLPYPDYSDHRRVDAPTEIAFTIVAASVILLSSLLYALINEKRRGIKTMLKIVGFEDIILWLGWFISTLIIGAFVYFLISLLLVCDFRNPGYPTIRFVDVSFLFAIFVYFFIVQMMFCFFFSSIFHSELLAVISFCILSLMFAFFGMKIYQFHNILLVRLSSLLPPAAFIHIFGIIGYHEMLGISLDWSNLFDGEYFSETEISLKFLFLALLIDALLFSFLFIYIETLNPGKYGYSRSIISLFKRVKSDEISEDDADMVYDPILKEKKKKSKTDPTSVLKENVHAGINSVVTIENLKKKFDSKDALKGINLSLNKNEILTLLGNKHSGKTTTIAILLGLTAPTSGSIKYHNTLDLLRNIKEFRSELGYCPQDNRLFPYFTVQDHLVFYGRLKGISKKEAESEAKIYIEIMDLTGNADDLGDVISTEMKRKLSISIALMGNAEILILDEPTSGLDAASQNKIWTLLAKLKKNRCVLMTTTTMKEASAIGDRIAVLNNGVIVCNGTPRFLEKAFAIGYEITLTRTPPPPPDPDPKAKPVKDPILPTVTQIKKGFPGTKISQFESDVIFNVPSFHTNKFPALFKTLESRSGEMRVEHIGVSVATLESIYLKIGSDSIYDFQGRPLQISAIAEEPTTETTEEEEPPMKGASLISAQFLALFKKKIIFTYRNWVVFIYRIIIPTMLMVVLMLGTKALVRGEGPIVLSSNLYPDSLALYVSTDMREKEFPSIFKSYMDQKNVKMQIGDGKDLEESALAFASEKPAQYRKDVVYGFEFQREISIQTIYYNKFARHSFPVSMNALHNALLFYYYPQESADLNNVIETINDPIENLNVTAEKDVYFVLLTDHSPILLVWFVLLGFFTIDLVDFVTIPVKAERVDGFKHVQFLSGVTPLVYWFNTLVFDFLFAFLIIIIRLVILMLFDEYKLLDMSQFTFIVLIVLLCVFLVSGIYFNYMISFMLTSRHGQYIFFLILNLVGCGLAFAFFYAQTDVFYKESLNESVGPEKIFLLVVYHVMLLISPVNFSLAFFKFIKGWRVNSLAAIPLPNTEEFKTSSTAQLEEKKTKTVTFFQFADKGNPHGILMELIFLIVDIFIYILIIYLIEFDRISQLFRKKSTRTQTVNEETGVQPDSQPQDDQNIVPESVVAERSNVEAAIQVAGDPEAQTSTVVISDDLQKWYRSFIIRKKVIVDQTNFVVNAGECFGILGPEESGKTTIFKMLAGEITPSVGDSWILNTKLSKNRKAYFFKTGYCTQSDSFLKELTGKEILELVATLRGVPGGKRREVIENWAIILGLDEVFSDKCGTYNEGNTRKLCAALALVGDPQVLLLDEPASGIDPISRRSLYTVLGRSKTLGQAVIVSSKSMQECEALCDKLMILIDGQMKFVGSPTDLKQQFAQAFNLVVILKQFGPKDTEESRIDDLLLLKFALQGKFGTESCVLISETRTSATYEINFSMPWSEAFQTMEVIKKGLKFIKEYHLSQKSLEDVYRSFLDEQ